MTAERFRACVLVRELRIARERLPPGIKLRTWLRTPISMGGKAPIDYLRGGNLTVSRGLIVVSRSRAMSSLTVPRPVPALCRGITREERVAALERLSPPPRTEQDEAP